MSKLDVAAVVSPFRIKLGLTPEGSAVITVSVTDSNGVPYTSLVQANFEVMMLFEFDIVPAHIRIFIDYYKEFPANSLPGVYEIGVSTQEGYWSPIPYTFVVAVKEDANRGQTVVLLDLSDLQSTDTEVQRS